MLCGVMGDIADWTLEQIEDDLYFSNVMYLEEHDSYVGPGRKRELQCKFCGKKNLHWRNIGGRWIMYENATSSKKRGEIHDCPENPLTLQTLKHIMSLMKSGSKV
jgi:hypothetical protein